MVVGKMCPDLSPEYHSCGRQQRDLCGLRRIVCHAVDPAVFTRLCLVWYHDGRVRHDWSQSDRRELSRARTAMLSVLDVLFTLGSSCAPLGVLALSLGGFEWRTYYLVLSGVLALLEVGLSILLP